jgi:protocatechuate 3,4-dioxygenase alpha subunit
MKLKQTPSQTVGPFFSKALLHEGWNDLTSRGAAGQPVVISGRVLDGDGAPVSDALLEIWQANAAGRYDHPDDARDTPRDPSFSGFGRVGSDAQGCFRFRTIKPGPVPGANASLQAPHINVSVFARGVLKRLVTRIYFPDEPLNAHDPVLNSLSDAARRATLIARPANGESTLDLHFDIVLQGDNETVFFDI